MIDFDDSKLMSMHMSEWILPYHWLHTTELWRKLMVMGAGSDKEPGPHHPCFGGELESSAESLRRVVSLLYWEWTVLGLLFHVVALVPQALCRCQLFEKLSYCSRSHRDDMFSVLNCHSRQSGLSTHFTRSYTSYLFLYNGFYWAALTASFVWELSGTWNVWLWDKNHGAQL